MGYFNAKGQWVPGENVALDSYTARVAGTFNGNPIEVGAAHTATVTLATTAVTGTNPTLNVKLQTGEDGVNWRDVPNGAFAQQTGVASQTISISGLSTYLRAQSVVAGTTPTFTGSLNAMLR